MAISTDVVGGLQAIAEAWVAAEEDLRTANEAKEQAHAEVERAKSRQATAERDLLTRVGQNIPTKVFHIGNKVLIVEYQKGVRCVPLETL